MKIKMEDGSEVDIDDRKLLSFIAIIGIKVDSIEKYISWIIVAIGLVFAMLFVHVSFSADLEFIPPLLHDTSNNPAADPNNPRVHGAEVITFGSGRYLFYADQLEIYKREIRNDGSLSPASKSRFNIPPYGDRDLNLFNYSICSNCRYGCAGYDVQGTVLWSMGEYDSPIFGESRRYVDSSSIGCFTFLVGSQQYMVGRLSPLCQGNSIVQINGINPENLTLVQCITDAVGTPISVDAGIWMENYNKTPQDPTIGWIYLFDSSLRRVYSYDVQDTGNGIRLQPYGWWGNFVWILDSGFSVRWVRLYDPIGVGLFNGRLSIFDLSNPILPTVISTKTLQLASAAATVEISGNYVWFGVMHTVDNGSSFVFDISDPTNPVEVDQEFFSLTQPWNQYNYIGNKGAAWDGNDLFLTRNSVLERVRLTPGQSPAIFDDGFESGDTGAWQ